MRSYLLTILHGRESLDDFCKLIADVGFALREFRLRVDTDPFGAFMDWNPDDSDPCNWSGVHCIGGKVAMLDLKGMSLGGTLAPELGKLSHLRALILLKNNFSGVIPKEIGGLYMLELLDLRGNNLTGEIPMEIGNMMSLKHLKFPSVEFEHYNR
ncbi:unnamed protein product [Spirodela intermedia]|uniref:Leucine-rich repeat-containing N-terminal plant-type domain-containing protein n=1 Tax=Spirodela intermedia TaxID=51605 RepID=A0A7I8LJL0_SPIIN|nr:unnamed protein product [Spirodela intermedia]